MAFIRELSTGGLILSGEISAEDRRERIRVAIHQRGLLQEMFEPELTYGQAFEVCFRRSIEMRRMTRDENTRFQPVLEVLDALGPDDDDDAGDEDDEEGLGNRSNTAA
jgi:hypothetical protein